MRIPLLHKADLARIAPMERDRKRICLEQLRSAYPPFSYRPLHAHLHELFNVQPTLFGPVKPTDWSIIEDSLRKRCKNGGETAANLSVARGIYDWIVDNEIEGRTQEFFPLSMGAGGNVSYWLPVILNIEGKAAVPFIDPRRSRGLEKEGRRFVFSMMHERIRVDDEDYANVRFVILKFPGSDDNVRAPVLYVDDGIELYSREQLESMVTETYELWYEVYGDRVSGARRAAAGQEGPLI